MKVDMAGEFAFCQGYMVKAEETEPRIRYRASTASIDRHQTIVKPKGLKIDKYLMNPIFLWAHDGYRGLFGGPPKVENTIGRVENIERTEEYLDHDALYAVKENPNAHLAYHLALGKFLNAVSIGFKPLKYHKEAIDGGEILVFDEGELLEISQVPIPANPDAVALVRTMSALLPRKARPSLLAAVLRGVVPSNVSTTKAPENETWKKPTLSDFTNKTWDELSATQKRRIAGHYAWAPKMPPDRFTDLSLPHHRPSDGAIVWAGVRAAMGAMRGARGGVKIPSEDRRGVYNHLSAHYRAFNRTPPPFKALFSAEERTDRELVEAVLSFSEFQGVTVSPATFQTAADPDTVRQVVTRTTLLWQVNRAVKDTIRKQVLK